jgi:hypothetical protein
MTYLKPGTGVPYGQDQAVCRPQPIGRHAPCANWSGEHYAFRPQTKGWEPQRLPVPILRGEDNGSRERNVWLYRRYFRRLSLSTVMRLCLHFRPRILTDIGKNSY